MAVYNVNLTATYTYGPRRLLMEWIHLWECNKALPAGGRVKIDPEARVTSLNGKNIRADVTDAFPFLCPGVALLIYTDTAGSRNLEVRVLWRGRWA